MFDFLKLKSALTDLGNQLGTLRREKDSLKRQRQDLDIAPGTRADVIKMFHGHIDAQAEKFPDRLRAAIEKNMSFGRNLCNSPTGRPDIGVLGLARENLSAPYSPADLEGALYYLMGPAIKKAVTDSINDMSWPAEAAPLTGRAAQIEALDRQIAKLEADEAELRRAATTAGVSV